MILVGMPAWGPTFLVGSGGEEIPAGCGPEAARLLLLYYDLVFGLDLVQSHPEKAISELHERMGTLTVEWQGVNQGLTFPWAFCAGLKAYVRARLSEPFHLSSYSGGLPEVFYRAVRLLQGGTPSILLFDWQGQGGIFPTHYALVVGYDLSAHVLIVNPGWGYEFQPLSFHDTNLSPASLFWLEFPTLRKTQEEAALPSLSLPEIFSEPPNRAVRLGGKLILLVWD